MHKCIFDKLIIQKNASIFFLPIYQGTLYKQLAFLPMFIL